MKIQMANLLLVEDNPGDVLLTRKALEKAKIANKLAVVTTGEAAMDYLHRRGKHQDSVRPDLILLDLNLPGMSGSEVLRAIKEDVTLRRIPVVVLTSSEADEDVLRTFDLHVNSYMVKPVDFTQMTRLIFAMEDWWFVLGRIPKE